MAKIISSGVYFLEFSQKLKGLANRPIKIGYTNSDVVSRVSTIQVGTPSAMSRGFYLTSSKFDKEINPSSLERNIHSIFQLSRKNGEWFDLEFDELEFYFLPTRHKRIIDTKYWKYAEKHATEEQMQSIKESFYLLCDFWNDYDPYLVDLSFYVKSIKGSMFTNRTLQATYRKNK